MPSLAFSRDIDRNAQQPWTVVGLCMAAYVLSFIDRQILALLIQPIQTDLAISDTQFGLLNGLAFSIFYATMGIPIAGLADRSSRPRIIVVGIAVWSLATMLSGLARSFGELFLARIAVGAGEAALSPAAYSLIADLFPRDRLGRAYAVYSLGSLLGTGLAFLVGGTIIAVVSTAGAWTIAGMALAGWQLTFVIVGAPGLLLALVIALTVKEPRARGADAVASPPLSAVLRVMHRDRAIYAPMMLGFSLSAMALFALLGWAPAVLIRQFGMTAQSVGFVLGPIAIVAGGGGNLTSGWLVDLFTRRGRVDAPFRVGMIGAAGVILPALALAVVKDRAAAVALVGAGFFFASFPLAPSTAIMQIAAPAWMRSRVSAMFLFCNSLIGLALGAGLVGSINDRLFASANIALAMAIVVAAAGVAALFTLNHGRRPFAAAPALANEQQGIA